MRRKSFQCISLSFVLPEELGSTGGLWQTFPVTPASELAAARRLVVAASQVVVLTGAGISTDSGIPDFRGPQGLWTLNPKAERTSNITYYLSDPEVREIAWQNRLHSPAWEAAPNAGHLALLALEQQGRLHTLVTQNIDGLHQLAGNDPARVVEVHGTMRRATCWSCHHEWPMEVFLDRVRAGEVDPDCPDCGGIVKSSTISFGQNLVVADLKRAFDAAVAGDLLLCVGSTLAVGPVNRMVDMAAASGIDIVIVNGSPTEKDDFATAIVEGDIATALTELLAPQ